MAHIDYKVKLTVYASNIYKNDFEEDLEYNLDQALYDDLDGIVSAIAKVDDKLAEQFEEVAGQYDCEASDILSVSKYDFDNVEFKEFVEDKIILYAPININIEGLKKIVRQARG